MDRLELAAARPIIVSARTGNCPALERLTTNPVEPPSDPNPTGPAPTTSGRAGMMPPGRPRSLPPSTGPMSPPAMGRTGTPAAPCAKANPTEKTGPWAPTGPGDGAFRQSASAPGEAGLAAARPMPELPRSAERSAAERSQRRPPALGFYLNGQRYRRHLHGRLPGTREGVFRRHHGPTGPPTGKPPPTAHVPPSSSSAEPPNAELRLQHPSSRFYPTFRSAEPQGPARGIKPPATGAVRLWLRARAPEIVYNDFRPAREMEQPVHRKIAEPVR